MTQATITATLEAKKAAILPNISNRDYPSSEAARLAGVTLNHSKFKEQQFTSKRGKGDE